MEILSWLWWLVVKIVGFAFGLVWFLLGGWVATLAQIAVIAFLIFGYKYGWRQALPELLSRAGPAGRYFGGNLWSWMRARSPVPLPQRAEKSERRVDRDPSARRLRRKEPGDVNLSTLLSVVALGGLLLAMAV